MSLTQAEKNRIIEEYFDAPMADISVLNDAFKGLSRDVVTRLSFYINSNGYGMNGVVINNTNYPLSHYVIDEVNDSDDIHKYFINGIKRCIIKKECDSVPIGVAVSSSLELSLIGDDYNFINKNALRNGCFVLPEIGIVMPDESTYWYLLGVFRIDTCRERERNALDIVAYDIMCSFDNTRAVFNTNSNTNAFSAIDAKINGVNRYTAPDLISVIDDTTRSQLSEIQLTVSDLNALNTCKTTREILSYISGKVGKFAYMHSYKDGTLIKTALRFGKIRDCIGGYYDDIEFVVDEFNNGSIYYGSGTQQVEELFIINQDYTAKPEFIINYSGEVNNVWIHNISVGTNDVHTMKTGDNIYCFDNKLITTEDANNIIKTNIRNAFLKAMPPIYTFGESEYEAGELNTSGTPLLSLGQVLYFYDKYGSVHRCLICGIEMDTCGKLNMTITSKEPQTEFTI